MIAIVNRSTAAGDAVVAALLPALQMQISRDFAAWWGSDATLRFVGQREAPSPGEWVCWILDNSDAPGDLGYHVDQGSVPEAKVFAAEDLRAGLALSITLSHELLEMLGDPTTQRTVPASDGRTYVVEVCDPVEADQDGYDIDGVRVSNFVTPRYFGMSNPADDPRFDHLGLLRAGLPALRPGGYCLFEQDGAWHTLAARHANGSLGRRALRPHGRSRWRAARRT